MSIKPLALWAVHQGWTIRFTQRTPEEAAGVLSTPDGPIPFRFEPVARLLHLPESVVQLDPYGWEVDEAGRTVFRSFKVAPRSGTESSPDPEEDRPHA